MSTTAFRRGRILVLLGGLVVLQGCVGNFTTGCNSPAQRASSACDYLREPPSGYEPSTQSTTDADISILGADWVDSLWLMVRYEATGDTVGYSSSDWVAFDADGVAYEFLPDEDFGPGVLRDGEVAEGWVHIEVPEGTDQLDVTFEQADSEPLYWTIEGAGGQPRVSIPTPSGSGDDPS